MNFDDSAIFMRTMLDHSSQEQQLYIYSLYKQTLEGDAPPSCPSGGFAAKAKWKAWDKQRGTPPEEARQLYVKIARRLQELHQKSTLADIDTMMINP